MASDSVTGEHFLRVVGRRMPRPTGQVPSAEDRAALDSLVRYRTCAPKGVFIYSSHDEMTADREQWTVNAMVVRARDGR